MCSQADQAHFEAVCASHEGRLLVNVGRRFGTSLFLQPVCHSRQLSSKLHGGVPSSQVHRATVGLRLVPFKTRWESFCTFVVPHHLSQCEACNVSFTGRWSVVGKVFT